MQNLLVWETINFIFVVILGTVLHFAYAWSGQKRFVGIFCPINESVWEHLKMLFMPMLLFSVMEYFTIGKDYQNYISAKSIGILLGLLFIIAFFYTYTGIIGRNYLWMDIFTFICGVLITFSYSERNINNVSNPMGAKLGGLLLLAAVALSFAVFTFRPPHLGIFIDPSAKKSNN